MQQLHIATDAPVSPDRCARELLSGMPSMMLFLRTQIRSNRQANLTVPHFRAMIFISHNQKPSLSAMAEHLGLSLPATSRMVNVLVQRNLVQRRARRGDRRCLCLSLTSTGQGALRVTFAAAQAGLAERFETLSARELSLVSRAFGILSRAFAPENCCPRKPAKRGGRSLNGAAT